MTARSTAGRLFMSQIGVKNLSSRATNHVIPSGAAKRRSRGIAGIPVERSLFREERDSLRRSRSSGHASTAAPDGASARNDTSLRTKEKQLPVIPRHRHERPAARVAQHFHVDRKSTRLNSSHSQISYAV